MSNNKQTAVEWLEEQLISSLGIELTKHQKKLFNDVFIKQAKEMEKQQKMQCWETAHQAGRFEGKGIAVENWQTFEQYYNEEYGGNNEQQ